MRILHTGDWHLGKNLDGKSRMAEQELFLQDFVQMVKDNQVDLVMIAGDIYDSSNPPAKAEKMFYDALKQLSENGKRLIVVIAGNHDNPERLIAAGPLAMEHGIIMVGTPKTVVQPGIYGQHKVVDSGEGYVEIEINGEKSVILTVPYPSEKRLNEVLYGGMDTEEEQLATYGERIHKLFHDLQCHYREDTINLAVSHLFTMGCEVSGSETGIQLGGSYILDANCLPLEAQYIALGHIHKPQIVPNTNKKVRYSGSPIHYNKNEIAFEKKCWLIDVVAGSECVIEAVPLKVYKPIEIWKCESIEDAIERCEQSQNSNAWVYIEIKTDRYVRENEIKQMKSYKDDILEIMPIIATQEEELGSQERLIEKSFEEIFKEFYKKQRGLEADQEVIELLLSIVGEGADDETN